MLQSEQLDLVFCSQGLLKRKIVLFCIELDHCLQTLLLCIRVWSLCKHKYLRAVAYLFSGELCGCKAVSDLHSDMCVAVFWRDKQNISLVIQFHLLNHRPFVSLSHNIYKSVSECKLLLKVLMCSRLLDDVLSCCSQKQEEIKIQLFHPFPQVLYV